MRAQDYVINLERWGLDDGLSDRMIFCIYQDKKGFIWVGSRNGLDRFDGYKFINYRMHASGLAPNTITRIMEDDAGRLWLTGADDQIIYFDPLSRTMMEPPAQLAGLRIRHIQNLGDGRMLLHTRDRRRFYIFKEGNTHPLNEVPLPDTGQVYFLVHADSSSIWVCQQHKKGLYQFNWEGRSLSYWPTVQVQNPQGNNWVLPWYNGFCETVMEEGNPLVGRVYKLSPHAAPQDISHLIPAYERGSQDELFPVTADSVAWRQGKLFHTRKGLLRNFTKEGINDLWAFMRCHTRDKNGSLWMGCNYGLYRLTVTPNKFRRYFYNPSFRYDNDNSYRNIAVLNGHLYAVNEQKGLLVTPLDNPPAYPAYKDLTAYNTPGHFSYAIGIKDPQHIYHINADHFYEIQLPAQVLQSYPVPGLKWPCRSMTKIEGDTWLLGLEQGLLWFNPVKRTTQPFTAYNQFPELAKQIVYHVLPGDSGRYWICSSRNLYSFDPAKGIVYRYSSEDTGRNFLPVLGVHHLHRDKEGIYWLAAGNGLLRWNRQKHEYFLYNRANGLTNDKIYAVYEDNHDRLWLSSDYGIMSLDKHTGFVNPYFEKNGITYREFNSASHYADAGGTLYFGSLNGVTSFRPDDFPRTGVNKENSLVITSILQLDRRSGIRSDNTSTYYQENMITLHASENLAIEFAMLHFSEPQKTTYYWKIGEIDSAWKSQNERILRFETLPYGPKNLYLKAIAADGTESNQLVIRINAVAPLYLQWWFQASIVLVVLLAGFLFYRWRVNQLQKINTRLDNMVQEKTADLQVSLEQKDLLMREIHHRVKNNLQVISTLLELQLAEIKDDNARKALQESQTRVRSIALVHQQLYQKENIVTIGIPDFVKDLFDQVTSIYNTKNQDIRLHNHIQPLFLDIDTAIPLGLILNELMTNSYKYAFSGHEGSVDIGLHKDEEYYVLTYRDSGPGLPADYDYKKSKSLGLTVIYSLSRQLGGYFEYKDNCFYIYFLDEDGRKMME